MSLEILPAEILAVVTAVVGANDMTDASAVRSECETWSRRLSVALSRAVDADGERIHAWGGLRWPSAVPARLEGDELAIGHVVCFCRLSSGDEYMIDLTAAQFGAMGWTGPIARKI
jgi:hypothetical protein